MKMGGAQEGGDGCLQIFKHPTQKESRSVSGIFFPLKKERTTGRWTAVDFSSFFSPGLMCTQVWYACTHRHTCVGACVCTCMWTPTADVGSLPQSLSTVFFEAGSLG